MKVENEVRQLFAKGLVAKYVFEDLVYKSSLMTNIIKKAKQYAQTNSTILISGETGTGKEILVQSIHNYSLRKKKPFISINCAALPEQLLESELFGYEEGAFTGSKKGGKLGLFETSHKGSIFLDEIASTTQKVQTQLLRVLQEKVVMRIGADRIIPIDVHVIAATNKNLVDEVQLNQFREDLYFRLNVN
jgi:transcriptional regulator with PAS, ATPase and Fis domain